MKLKLVQSKKNISDVQVQPSKSKLKGKSYPNKENRAP
jgi:hypothetical protein